MSQMFTCGLSDLLLLAVGSLVVFLLREYILKDHILVSSEHKSYYQESNILIIAFRSVVTVALWLDGSFDSQNRL